MSEVSSGFKIGVGVILACVFVFIILPISSCLFCGTCAALVGSSEQSGDLSTVDTQTITQSTSSQELQQQTSANQQENTTTNGNPSKSVHIASFQDGTLDECVDISLTILNGSPEKSESLLKKFENNMQKTTKNIDQNIIKQQCQSAFNDRQVLASCVVSQKENKDEVELSLDIKSFYYNYATVGERDNYMQDCIKQSGTWNAIDRNSREWRRAKLEYNLNKMNKLANDIQR